MINYSVKKKGFWERISITNKLIFITCLTSILAFILESIFGADFFMNYIAIKPSLIFSFQSLWTLITSMFAHANLIHLLANMFSLFFLGNFLEKIIGKKRFFWVYFISGIFGGILYCISAYLFGTIDVAAVGASGAIFGVLGVLAVLVPYSKIYLILGPFILLFLEVVLGNIIPSSYLSIFEMIINILLIVMVFSLFSFSSSFRKFSIPVELSMWVVPIVAIVPLIIINYFIPLPIGNSAHLGGLIIGLFFGLYLKHKFPNKARIIRNNFR